MPGFPADAQISGVYPGQSTVNGDISYPGTIYAGGQATNLPSKQAFYDYIGANQNLAPSEFYNNPWNVSSQEINGLYPQGGGGAGAPGGGTGAGGTTQPDNSLAIGQINASLGRLPGQQAAGYQNIDNSANSALQQLLQGYNVANRNYGQNKQDSALGYVGAKNTIGTQAGQSLNGLLRLLGSRGAGGSSAYLTGAPQAVARGASLQRADAGNTFGANNRALDTNWGDYNNNYNQQVAGVGTQKLTARQTLENNIATSKAGLLSQLAGLQSNNGAAQPYLDQANAISDRLASYVPPAINYSTPAYQAPTAASYTTNPNPTPQYSGGGATDYFSPYLQNLLGKKQQVVGA